MTPAEAKRHGYQVLPRSWGPGRDGCVHALGVETALCGVALANSWHRGTYAYCPECGEIVREVDALTGKQ